MVIPEWSVTDKFWNDHSKYMTNNSRARSLFAAGGGVRMKKKVGWERENRMPQGLGNKTIFHLTSLKIFENYSMSTANTESLS